MPFMTMQERRKTMDLSQHWILYISLKKQRNKQRQISLSEEC